MKKFLPILMIFLSCCSTNSYQEDLSNDFKFSKSMSFEEISLILEQYTKNSKYPNIDN